MKDVRTLSATGELAQMLDSIRELVECTAAADGGKEEKLAA
jgi:hypothetical protein